MEKRGPGRPRKEDTDEYNDIEDLLAELDGNYKVMIDRIEPEYCKGFIGKYYVGSGSGISLEEIKRRWGGRVFKVRVFDDRGKLSKQRTISIDEEPRREGRPINPDGTTQRDPQNQTTQNQTPSSDMFTQILNSNLSDQMKQLYLAHMAGLPMFGGMQPQKDPEKDLHFYKLINDMMDQNRNAAQLQAQANLELMGSIFEMKKKYANESAPADPVSQLEKTIELVRAMNGVQSELQPQHETSIASQLIDSSLPMLQNAFTEWMTFKKAAIQAEVQKNLNTQNNRPPLPARIPAAIDMPQMTGRDVRFENYPPPWGGVGIGIPNPSLDDTREKARQMARLFRSLPADEQTQVMGEFFAALEPGETNGDILESDPAYMENIEPIQNFDTIENKDLLPADDRAILESLGDNGNEIETGHVSDGDGTGAIDGNDQIDREGNSGGFPLPSY